MSQKEIRYLNKDFDSFKSNLIEFQNNTIQIHIMILTNHHQFYDVY